MRLDKNKDYGFTVNATESNELPFWDRFRFEKIQEIFTTCETIIDFRSSSRRLYESFKNVERNRISVDINESYNPDVVGDICDLNMFKDESIDGIICTAILEHVYNLFKAVQEIYRILKKGGKVFVYLPWIWRYHASKGEYEVTSGFRLMRSSFYLQTFQK